MWDSRMWQGLMRWVEDEKHVERRRIVAEQARLQISKLLAEENLGQLTLDEFNKTVWQFGDILRRDDTSVGSEQEWAPEELRARFNSREWHVTGNRTVGGGARVYYPAFKGSDEEKLEVLRGALAKLLYSSDNLYASLDEVRTEPNFFQSNWATMILCMMYPDNMGIMNEKSKKGMRKLAWLLGTEEQWGEHSSDYRSFNELLHEISEASGQVLADMLEVDAFLNRLGDLKEPGYWKVALGLDSRQHEELAQRCKEGGFAAIGWAPEDEDPGGNVKRFRQIQPGDYVVMHLKGKIGGVGRVVRPYYEIDRDGADEVAGHWWRRIDVDWVLGDHDYGDLLPGAKQRLTVVDLDEADFWQLADMYATDPHYAKVMSPPERAWIFQCNPERWDLAQVLEKPMPFKDYWTVNQHRGEIHVGDTVYLWKSGDAAGIYGIAKVASEEYERPDEFGEIKVDLVYEHRFEEPLLRDRLMEEEATAELEIIKQPQATNFKLVGTEAEAIADMLALPREEYFVFVVGPDAPGQEQRGEEYHYTHKAAGKPRELSTALQSGEVRYLLYKTGPEHAITSFGSVLDVEQPEGAPEVERSRLKLENHGFQPSLNLKTDGAKNWMSKTAFLRAGIGVFSVNSVLPVSARDYYTVVRAGMRAEQDGPLRLRDVAKSCYADTATMMKMLDLLREKGQAIFYGPPGTGKTFVALKLAEYLAQGNPSRWELIQFHPSYTYEDFMEGIKPESVQVGERCEVSYPVRAGSFMRFCQRARSDPEQTYIFVIDEINRGQIAKIFGELMFLLEYRDQQIELAYTKSSPDGSDNLTQDTRQTFSIPSNVLIIGTMNTADRSIALVDHALRRRFVFYPFYPDDADFVQPMLRRWLGENAEQMSWVADLFDGLNEKLEEDVGRDLLLGHSYFMKEGLDEEKLREIWRFQIEPLLQEYFVGSPERLEEYDLEQLVARARGGEEGYGDDSNDNTHRGDAENDSNDEV